MADFVSFKGQFLVAAPNMKDPIFAQSVIYLCEHSPKGAMGLVINRAVALSVASLMERVGIENHNERLEEAMLFDGGPVQVERGFVLHSPQKKYHSSLMLTGNMTLSTSKDVLEAMADAERCPEKFFVSLGYAGWSEGQLEDELSVSGWLIAPADEAIIFDVPAERRYEAALASIGLTPNDFGNWMDGSGHA